MTQNVKIKLKEFLECIGGISSIEKHLRISLIKRCILLLDLMDRNPDMYDRAQYLYPLIGTTEPIKLCEGYRLNFST